MSKDGVKRTERDGTAYAVNSTQDPKVPGGYYHTQVDSSGNKSTAVYNSDGTLANVPANKGLKD